MRKKRRKEGKYMEISSHVQILFILKALSFQKTISKRNISCVIIKSKCVVYILLIVFIKILLKSFLMLIALCIKFPLSSALFSLFKRESALQRYRKNKDVAPVATPVYMDSKGPFIFYGVGGLVGFGR